MKKLIIALMAVSLTICTLTAQGSNESASGKTKLTIAGRDGAYGEALQSAADKYSQMHPDVEFEILKLSGSDLFEKSVIDIKTGTGTYDIVYIDDTNITQFQKSGWLEDLEGLGYKTDSDMIEPAVKLGRFPYKEAGTLEAAPIVGNVVLFAYRKDLFTKYGHSDPVTWTQILEGVKDISENESDVDGVVFRGVKGNPIVTGFMPIFWAFGGKVLDEDGNATLDNQNTLDAFNYFLELAKYAPMGVSMYQSTQVKDAIYTGTAAVASEVWPGWIGDLENPEKSKVVGKVAVVKSPGEKVNATSMLGVWLAAIPKSSKNKQAAADFLQYLTSSEAQTMMAEETGVPPTRKSVFEDASLIEKYPWYPAQENALMNGVPRPRSPQWKQIEDELGSVLQRALIGELTAEQAVKEAQSKVSDIVNQ
jgi:multiple sugar transport system substrate-binding protein